MRTSFRTGLLLAAWAPGLLAPVPAAETPANFVADPGFESGVGPWGPRDSERVLVTTQAHTGAAACWVTNRTATWHGVAQSLAGRLRPGGDYFCSAWARAESQTSQVLQLTFEQRDGAGTRYVRVAQATVTNNAWTFLSGVFSLNVTGALSNVVVYLEGPAAGVNLLVDDVAVMPLSGFRLAAARRDVLLGGVGGSSMTSSAGFGRVVGADYHIAGPENAVKFASIHPGSNTWSFSTANAILDHATAHGQLARGHTLLWHGSVPAWVATNTWTTAQLRDIAYDHIDTVVGYYRDRLFCWDAVNEAFNSDGTMRSTIWYDAPGIGYAGQGTKYLEETFKRARAADPDGEIVYNDYGAETDNAKSDAIYAMAQDFTARGVPLDGIGFQFHLSATPSLSSMRANFQRFDSLGLSLHITELDVRVPVDSNGVATAAALASQADTYFSVVGTALAFPRTRVVQTWGFSDRSSWIPAQFPGYGAALPLDEDLNRKPAWWALRDALANQAETLSVLATSAGDGTAVASNTSFSAGAARQLQAGATGDFITLAADVPYPGEYSVRVGVRKSSAGGQFQLAVTRAPDGAFVNLGAVQDTYAASTAYVDLNLGSFAFTGAGAQSFRFTVAGKNAGSSDYDLTLDYLRLTPTGADGNQAPILTAIADQTIFEEESAGPLAFVVSDRETVEAGLTLAAISSNPSLLPTSNLVLTGGGPERLLTATPAPDAFGVATVTVIAADAAGASTSNAFVLTVVDVNDAPAASPFVAHTTAEDTPAGPIALHVGDLETPSTGLVVTALSSNPALAPVSNIVVTLATNPWTGVDLGTPAAAGSGTPGDVCALTASGADIWGTADEGHFLYQPMTGDGEMVARVASLQPTDPWAKAGVMMRASTNAGSANCYMLVSASNGVSFQRRPSSGATSLSTRVTGVAAPCWVRLVKTGTNCAGYYATDTAGARGPWVQVGATTGVALGASPLRGLAGTAHDDGVLCASTFDHVSGPTNAGGNRAINLTPAPNAFGTATISLVVSDGDLSTTQRFDLIVTAVNDAPVLAAVTNRTVGAGQTMAVTNSASDIDVPPQTLTFSLLLNPTGATIGASSGVVTWRPAVAQASSTNLFRVRVADNGAPILGATQQFSVVVRPLAAPSFTQPEATGGLFRLTVTGDPGPDYTVQASSNFIAWSTLFTTNAPALPFPWTDPNARDFLTRFYRVLLGP